MLETPFAQIKPVTGTNGGRSGALAASDGQNDAPETDFDTAYNDNAPAAASENEEASSDFSVDAESLDASTQIPEKVTPDGEQLEAQELQIVPEPEQPAKSEILQVAEKLAQSKQAADANDQPVAPPFVATASGGRNGTSDISLETATETVPKTLAKKAASAQLTIGASAAAQALSQNTGSAKMDEAVRLAPATEPSLNPVRSETVVPASASPVREKAPGPLPPDTAAVVNRAPAASPATGVPVRTAESRVREQDEVLPPLTTSAPKTTPSAVVQKSAPFVARVASAVPGAENLVLLKMVSDKDRLELFSTVLPEPDAAIGADTRTQSGIGSASQAIFARPETPGLIGRQIAEAIQSRPGQPVEVSLNPQELGRVRINIAAAETGVTVTVLAERPETLELMRRNIDELAREFQTIGYQSINFAFAEGHAQQQQQDFAGDGDTPTGPAHLALDFAEEPTNAEREMTSTSGVDLRL